MSPLSAPIVHPHRGRIPVLLSVPHSGRDYPDWLIDMARSGGRSLETLEDPLVDRLVWRALKRGCGAVIAVAPRAAIDCNRSERDVDPSVVTCAPADGVTARARGGLGIVPARTHRDGYLWRRAISPEALAERLDQAHRPFHRAVADQITDLNARFGCALLIDCHSMPPPGPGVAPIVVGNLNGRSAQPWLSRLALDIIGAAGLTAGLNEPFAGGHILEQHADPAAGIHALQIEIDRSLYLDASLRDPGPGFDAMARLLDRLAVELGTALAERSTALAAE